MLEVNTIKTRRSAGEIRTAAGKIERLGIQAKSAGAQVRDYSASMARVSRETGEIAFQLRETAKLLSEYADTLERILDQYNTSEQKIASYQGGGRISGQPGNRTGIWDEGRTSAAETTPQMYAYERINLRDLVKRAETICRVRF